MEPADELYQTKEFAERAGVTVRTLHFYDQNDLLKPAKRLPNGYRLYGERELERLEQILALRFVGFSLDNIRQFFQGPPMTLDVALRMQRLIVAEQKRRIEAALEAIDDAQAAFERDPSGDRWEMLANVIEVFKVSNETSWTQNYYNEAAKEKLEEMRRTTPASVIEKGQRDWAELIAEVEAAQDEDPASEHAQALAKRWRDLVGQFTKGDPNIQDGLNKLWSDSTHWPKDFKRPWTDEADAFIKKAMNCG